MIFDFYTRIIHLEQFHLHHHSFEIFQAKPEDYIHPQKIYFHIEDEPMSPIMSGSHIDTLNDYKLFTTLINNPEVRSNVYDLHIFTISYFELEFKDGYLIKKI